MWQDILIYLSLVIFLGGISSYFALDYYQKKSAKTLEDLEAQLAEIKADQEIVSLEEEIFAYQKKIGDFSQILDSYQLSSNFFEFIESLTHPKVRWLNFNLSPETLTVSLSGRAEDFQTLGQQILILKKLREEGSVEKIDLSNIKLGEEGGINFGLSFSFEENILK